MDYKNYLNCKFHISDIVAGLSLWVVLLGALAVSAEEAANDSVSNLRIDDDLFRPFTVLNQNPLVALKGAPRELGAVVVEEGEFSLDLAYAVASSFDIGRQGAEQIILDGESERYGARMLWGIAPGWEIGVDIPWIRHSGGYLDDLIIDWHDLFNLPQNGRDVTVQDRLAFSYSGPNDNFNLTDDVSGLGDIQLLVARQVRSSANTSTLLRAHIKLPTGDSGDLLGSGGVDVALSIHHQQKLSPRWLVGAWAGATYVSNGDVLENQSRNLLGHGGARVAYQVARGVSLKVQWDIHSQVYEDTRLRQLNEIAYLLSFGGTIKFSQRSALDLVVVENYPHPEISPDVAFQLTWRARL